MLFKVVRENETTYYIPNQIRKITISPVYGREDYYDVSFYIENVAEIARMFHSYEEAEKFVSRLYELMNMQDNRIIDLSKSIEE